MNAMSIFKLIISFTRISHCLFNPNFFIYSNIFLHSGLKYFVTALSTLNAEPRSCSSNRSAHCLKWPTISTHSANSFSVNGLSFGQSKYNSGYSSGIAASVSMTVLRFLSILGSSVIIHHISYFTVFVSWDYNYHVIC